MCVGCFEQRRNERIVNAVGKCENKWQYFKLDRPIKGVVLLHTKGYCGYVHIHSNTIIVTDNNDTIRVDGPCITESVAISDSVIVHPYESDNVKGAIGDLKYDCSIRKTCYGLVTKIR
jgi:hypothetical protein